MEAFYSHSGCRKIPIKQKNRYSLASSNSYAIEDSVEEEGALLRVFLNKEIWGQQLFKYHWRSQCKANIVKVLSASRSKDDSCGLEITVICEKVKVVNGDILKKVNLGQMLYFAKTILKTSLFLSKVFGQFSINHRMIGLNRKGEIKLWIHQNFAENSRQFPISSQTEFFRNLISFLENTFKENKLFQLYLRNLTENIACLKEISFFEQFHNGFLRLHWIKNLERIQVKHLEKEQHLVAEKEGRPSLDKLSNQTADISENNNESGVHHINGKNIHLSHIPPSFCHSKNLQSKNKQNNIQCLIQNASSSLPKPFLESISRKDLNLDQKQSLNTMARLQQSVLIQLKQTTPKQAHNVLSGYGRLCESTTAQAMILEQFQWIYE